MSEILLWTLAVFAVLGLPPLLAVLASWQKDRRTARTRERRDGRAIKPGWPGMLLAACVL